LWDPYLRFQGRLSAVFSLHNVLEETLPYLPSWAINELPNTRAEGSGSAENINSIYFKCGSSWSRQNALLVDLGMSTFHEDYYWGYGYDFGGNIEILRTPLPLSGSSSPLQYYYAASVYAKVWIRGYNWGRWNERRVRLLPYDDKISCSSKRYNTYFRRQYKMFSQLPPHLSPFA